MRTEWTPEQVSPTDGPAERLEYLRTQIQAESISYGEIAELQDLAEHIEPGDVELREWAGLPEREPDPSEAVRALDREIADLQTSDRELERRTR